MPEKIIERSVSEELKTSYLTYALSVIVSRALPDVRDGLKPVHRRILYMMHGANLVHNRPFKKCATVVGQVISNYHPHGDAAIYESLVRMAQTFSLRYPLIDGQGNFGSMDGDKAAAYRYTEARMTQIANELLKDLGKETVDFASNFDESRKEPTVLPAAMPNLLVNGSYGIAVGMATNIPPHNLKEVVEAVVHLIENPEAPTEALLGFIKGPDFPTAGIIHGLKGMKAAYQTGRGAFKLRGRVEVEELAKGREALVITEIPYQVNKAELVKRIAELVKAEVIKGPNEIRDESDRRGVRIVIELKRDAHSQTVLNQLYKHTPLEVSYGMNVVALVGKTPQVLPLRTILQCFIKHRFQVTTRRIQFDLRKAEARLHLVEGFLKKALPNLQAVVETIRTSRKVEAAHQALRQKFHLSEKQATAILELRLARLVGLEVERLEKEYLELERAIKDYQAYLEDDNKIYALLKDELRQIASRYGDERKTEVSEEALETLELEDYIQKDNVVVSISDSGYIKRMPLDSYRLQSRGGVGAKAVSGAREDDLISQLFIASTHDFLFFVTSFGRMYYLKSFEIPTASRIARGTHVKRLLALAVEEKIYGGLSVSSLSEENLEKSFLLFTKRGFVKRSRLKDFINAKRRGIQAISLTDQDEVVGLIESAHADEDVMLFSRNGLATRTKVSNIRLMGRTARGVIGMRLSPKDFLIGALKVQTGDAAKSLIISEKGLGKRLRLEAFNNKGRGTKGQIYFKLSERSGPVVAILSVLPKQHIFITTTTGKMIRLAEEEVPLLKKHSTGARLVNLTEGNLVKTATVGEELITS